MNYRTFAAFVLGGAAMLGLAACGSSNAPASQAPSSSAPSSQRGGPAAAGSIASLAASSIEVQNPASGQVTVNYSGSTTFTNRVSAALADVTTGSCVVVTGTGTPLVARAVEVSTDCTTAGGGMRPQNGNGNGNGNGNASRAPRPSGTNNAGRGAAGKVTAVTGNGFTVQQDNRETGATTDIQVTVDNTTTYSKLESATATALKVGECVSATGQTDDTGAVTAKSIAISQPGPNGCATGRRTQQGSSASNGSN